MEKNNNIIVVENINDKSYQINSLPFVIDGYTLPRLAYYSQ